MNARAIRRIVVHGRVQGVGFRAFVEDEASRHDLAGWVRNRREGTVEAVLAGPPDLVAAVIEACRRGPPGARVDDVAVTNAREDDLALRPAGAHFATLRTI